MQHKLAPSSIDPSSGRALLVSLRAFQINCPLSQRPRGPPRILLTGAVLWTTARWEDSVRDDAMLEANQEVVAGRSTPCVCVFACFKHFNFATSQSGSLRPLGRMERCNSSPAALPRPARFRFLLIVHGLPASWRGPSPLLSPSERSKRRGVAVSHASPSQKPAGALAVYFLVSSHDVQVPWLRFVYRW